MFEGEGVFLHYIKNEQDTLCQREQETTMNPNELLAQKALYQPNLWNGIHNQGSKRTSFLNTQYMDHEVEYVVLPVNHKPFSLCQKWISLFLFSFPSNDQCFK